MKLTDEQRDRLRRCAGERDADPEAFHAHYDELMRNRLLELDPEFVRDLDAEAEGLDFWYA